MNKSFSFKRKLLIILQILSIFLISPIINENIVTSVEGASEQASSSTNSQRYHQQHRTTKKKKKTGTTRRNNNLKREIRPGRFPNVDRFDEVYFIVRNTFLIAIAPCLISFLWSVYRDPATPWVAKALWRMCQERMLGLLSVKKVSTSSSR
jgi:hypothetical protein